MSAPFEITPEDHERGFKDLPVVHRNGLRGTIRLTAPSALAALGLYRDSIAGQDVTNALIGLCVKDQSALDSLDVDSLCEVVGAAMALAWGVEKQKKILAAGEALLGRLQASPPNSAPSGSRSLAPASGWITRLFGAGPRFCFGRLRRAKPQPSSP